MLIAERYILRRILVISGMTLGSLVVLVLVTQVLVFVNVVTDSGEAILTFISLAAMLMPAMVTIVLPFALLIGVIQTFNTMHTDSEIIVLEASGASHSVLIRPVMVLATALSLFTLVNTLVIEPAANRHLRDIITDAGSNLVKFAVRSGSFHELGKNLYIQIAGQLPGGDFDGVFIADMREAETELIYYAKRASTVTVDGADLLVMQDGEIQRRNVKTNEVSIITFKTYALDYASFGPARGGQYYAPKERSTAALVSPDPDDKLYQVAPHLLRGEIHRRLTDWLYVFAFATVALYFTIGARTNREERLWSMAAAVAVALAFRGMGFMVLGNAGRTALQSSLLYLFPITCIVLFGYLLLAGRRFSMPQAWLHRMEHIIQHLGRVRDQIADRIGRSPAIGGSAKR